MTGTKRPERDAGWEIAVGSLVVGLVAGALLGSSSVVYLDYRTLVTTRGATTTLLAFDNLTPSQPGPSLRIIEAVGLLLPLFVALLNVVIDPASEFDVSRVNASLLAGIISLVVAGGFAVVAGFFSDLAFVPKASLVCLLVVFALIGNAAMKLLRLDEPDSYTGGHASTEPAPATNEESDSESKGDASLMDAGSNADAAEDVPDQDCDDTTADTESTEERTDERPATREQEL